ncbi:polysaccharide pyruvyl transferase family protein [Psychromonas antarctica]|uniref:polysaccharide pyruvyl transferase family protein n=1 Tax=Psychromonas antarctica TaxID=67573 RepID=UPI001EE804A6|nr:polysaccharide pyruvyl transferase family protein [Psychromonas antarctica]MCG6202895.1 polysaccharide pyruvyl transferase family protein [Psychromonas antarctica]
MDSLKNEHKKLAELINNRKVTYLDIPVHFNVGDILIYKGTEAFFDTYDIDVIYRCAHENIEYKKIENSEVILLHGGGNFGDLYSLHQNLREDIIRKFKHKTIICLPQTIHFEDSANLAKSAALFKEHQDFHFCVRDILSVELAKEFTENVLFMPDMAHHLHPLIDKTESGISNVFPPKILNLVRVDAEKQPNTRSIVKKGFDWKNLISREDEFAFNVYLKMNKVPWFSSRVIKLWGYQTENIVFRSINYFNAFTVVHTDRLHGFILAALLGKEICLYDNSYGKNTNYYKAWLKDYPFITAEQS